MSGRSCLWILSLILLGKPATADPPLSAQVHVIEARTWLQLTEYQKAIEEFEQAYRQEKQAVCLYWIAQCYERLAALPTKALSEALESKQRALSLYEGFIETAPETEPWREMARARIEPLRQDIKELSARKDEQELALKVIQNDIRTILNEIRTLREQILRRERGSTQAGWVR